MKNEVSIKGKKMTKKRAILLQCSMKILVKKEQKRGIFDQKVRSKNGKNR